MAVKDHSLDDKIIQAAKAEFLQHGFQKASLHKIAERAGTTTGALYTRYKNKDALFVSLVSGALSEIGEQYRPLQKMYEDVQKSGDAEKILEAIYQEEQVCLDMLFEYYDECVLFFCRSEGSSIETQLKQLMSMKASQTAAFLKSIAKKDIDLDGVEMIMSEQFRYYQQILQKGYTKEKAVSCMETVRFFLNAGWKALFNEIL